MLYKNRDIYGSFDFIALKITWDTNSDLKMCTHVTHRTRQKAFD